MCKECNSDVCVDCETKIQPITTDKNKNFDGTQDVRHKESIYSFISNPDIEEELRDVKAVELDFTKGSNCKQFCSIFGGAIQISMAALDPGNIAADIDIAGTTGLKSFWVLALAHILAYYYQDASLTCAVGAKMDVAKTGSKVLNKATSYTLWVMIELALIASDTQEILGAAFSQQIQFGIDLWIGVIICVILTLGILMIQQLHQQYFEYIFGFFLGVMGITFWINFLYTKPNFGDVMEGFIPNFAPGQMGVSMSLFGAIVMPHNLYLQSSLVMTRRIENLPYKQAKKAVGFFRLETFIILFVSFVINMAVIGSFAAYDISGISGDNFSFTSAGKLIEENLGKTFQILYAIGLFASGMSSTSTGSLTGQYVMNGYCNFKINKKLRIVLTRSIALVPCLLIVNLAQVNEANTVMNTIQAIQLPFVLIPVCRYIMNREIMGEFAFTGVKLWFIFISALGLIVLNVWNVLLPMLDLGYDSWILWTFLPVFSQYIGFLGYQIFLQLDTFSFLKLKSEISKTVIQDIQFGPTITEKNGVCCKSLQEPFLKSEDCCVDTKASIKNPVDYK